MSARRSVLELADHYEHSLGSSTREQVCNDAPADAAKQRKAGTIIKEAYRSSLHKMKKNQPGMQRKLAEFFSVKPKDDVLQPRSSGNTQQSGLDGREASIERSMGPMQGHQPVVAGPANTVTTSRTSQTPDASFGSVMGFDMQADNVEHEKEVDAQDEEDDQKRWDEEEEEETIAAISPIESTADRMQHATRIAEAEEGEAETETTASSYEELIAVLTLKAHSLPRNEAVQATTDAMQPATHIEQVEEGQAKTETTASSYEEVMAALSPKAPSLHRNEAVQATTDAMQPATHIEETTASSYEEVMAALRPKAHKSRAANRVETVLPSHTDINRDEDNDQEAAGKLKRHKGKGRMEEVASSEAESEQKGKAEVKSPAEEYESVMAALSSFKVT